MLLSLHTGYRLIMADSLTDEARGFAPLRIALDATAAGEPLRAADGGIGPSWSIRPRVVDLGEPVAPDLRSAVWARTGDASSRAFAGGDACPDDASCDGFPGFLSDTPFATLLLSVAAALSVLRLYWFLQIRRDLHALSAMARTFGAGGATWRALEHRVRGLCLLARALSDMMCRHRRSLDDQARALAAFSQQLDARVAQLRARALRIAQWHTRVAFIEDIDLFLNIARQCIDLPGRHSVHDAQTGVDAYLRDRFLHGSTMEDANIALRLGAGADFTLPRHALERLIDNLVGNALAHGAPPVEICTMRGVRSRVLSVRDHGDGIRDGDLAAATRPFVRLEADDTRRADGGHWGLGLSIVRRLAHQCGAKLRLGNHPDGGLHVCVIVPVRRERPTPGRDAAV